MIYYLSLAETLFLFVSLCFGASVLLRRNDVADVAWGLGFVLLAWVSFAAGVGHSPRGLVVSTLVSIWGLRLALSIYRRHQGQPEDYRYRAWRDRWGKWFYVRSYAQVYLFQGGLIFLIALPILAINYSVSSALGWLDAVGVMLWLVGFYFESVGDSQLARFKKDPANQGKLMQTGLWSYSRHPNYFGEVTLWWGIWLISLGLPGGIWTIIGPLTITVLILKVSGLTLLEKKMAKHPDFDSYRRRTSRFWPRLPRQIE